MIRKLRLQNFKSHRDTTLNLANLTLLCGSNGVGKSSAIHALLLLRESFLENSNFDYLNLRSNPVTVGTAQDALYQFSDENTIRFMLETDIQTLTYSFSANDAALTKTLLSKTTGVSHKSERENLEQENIFSKNCQFISAARLGPQPSYLKDDVVVEVHNQLSVMEGKAEYFLHYLFKYKDHDVREVLRNSNVEEPDLLSQTIAWEREISEGVNILIQDQGNLGYELKYSFNTESSAGKTYEFQANNVGFGLTYVMPIIVAVLAAPTGSILFIENPEAHLHPNGQAKLIELICLAAEAGVQVVLETHSDHIINGILVQTKQFEETQTGISREHVSVYYFDRDQVTHCSTATKIEIEPGGVIRYPPEGFFDQFTIDRKKLLGV